MAAFLARVRKAVALGPRAVVVAVFAPLCAFWSRLRFVVAYVRGVLDLALLLFRVKKLGRHAAKSHWSLADEWAKAASEGGARTFVEMAEPGPGLGSMTYEEADELSNSFAAWLGSVGVRPGETVALLMSNSCEFIVAQLGVLKYGCRAALLNVSLGGQALDHCLDAALGEEAAAKIVVADADLFSKVAQRPMAYVFEAHAASGAPPPVVAGPQWSAIASYIYTSGTTGFPKASRIVHLRAWSAGLCFKTLCRLRPSDRVYCALPLYHSTAGLLVLWGCVHARCTIVVRKKFSASHFASDVDRCKVTGCAYVGEMARYLVEYALVEGHVPRISLKFAFGNGLPREVWQDFQRLYGVKRIIELYGSTEGNVNLFNNVGLIGACGLVPPPFGCVYPIIIARIEASVGEDGQPVHVRDAHGRLFRCKAGEAGELLAAVDASGENPARRFDGYADAEATARKLVRDVCKKGDAYFRSGDVVVQSWHGAIYFVDRLGETFRYKGENVSTCELAAHVVAAASNLGVRECVAYGALVPRQSGRCGMVAIVLAAEVAATADWLQRLYDALVGSADIAPYAVPRFVRIVGKLTTTSTHKYQKQDLVAQGYEHCGADAVFFFDAQPRTFAPLTQQAVADIHAGAARI
ncbi:hypothetical protein M885DRAFT_479259 [Pelagophyceae sp. CCMP2097]|nr:hypothetical protein M885DRAFT_479259 [Pelagophyceae sp. CCMP2097]